jgi:flagellar biosynthesis/type III secretory pathway M-ring protein FliF/YscJ
VGWPEIVFGAVLVAVLLFLSLFYGWRQVRLLRRLRHGPELPLEEGRFQHRQAWRRLSSSVLLLLLAGLLACVLAYEAQAQGLADLLGSTPPAERPELNPEQRGLVRLWGGLVVALLVVLLLVLVLAALDLWATRRYGLRQYRRLQADRRAMIERQAARLRQEGNGHS